MYHGRKNKDGHSHPDGLAYRMIATFVKLKIDTEPKYEYNCNVSTTRRKMKETGLMNGKVYTH